MVHIGVRHERGIPDDAGRLPIEPLPGLLDAGILVPRAVAQQQRPHHLRAELHRPARQLVRPVQHRGQPAQRPRVVAQRVGRHVALHLRVARHQLRRDVVHHLVVGDDVRRQAAPHHGQPVRLQGGREAQERRLEDPAAHAGRDGGLGRGLGRTSEREGLAAAHGVAQDEERHITITVTVTVVIRRELELILDESRHVGQHARRGARLALVAGLLHAAPPPALVEAVDGDAALRQVREESVVPVHVVAEAVDQDHLGFRRAVRLCHGFLVLAKINILQAEDIGAEYGYIGR